jgi:hypothetical protein
VRLGLEIPHTEQPVIDRFLASAGRPDDRAALVIGRFWHYKTPDGRSSRAMVELIDRMRVLKIPVLAFDRPMDSPMTDPSERDIGMATNILAAATDPTSIVITLSGNVHNRKNGFRKQVTMGQHLVQQGATVLSLNGDYGTGSSWMLRQKDGNGPDGGGPGPIFGRAALGKTTAPAPHAITLEASQDGAYDGTFNIPSPTFSPPAAMPMTERQKLRGELVALEATAFVAYRTKRYAQCAEVHAELAKRDAVRRADYAYTSACCFALVGDTEQAFAQLADAVDQGLTDAKAMREDADLATLHTDARWAPLVDRVAARDR